MKVGPTAALAAMLAALLLILAAPADTARAQKQGDEKSGRIVFASDRSTGNGVKNPEGDFEVFLLNPYFWNHPQPTENAVDDFDPTLSPDGHKIAFVSQNIQASNPEGDAEIYTMNIEDSDGRNLTNNGGSVNERDPHFSPDGQQIAFTSFGAQPSNPEGDFEVYWMNVDGSDQQNLTNTSGTISDFDAAISPDGQRIAYVSAGARASNPEGEDEIYAMNALDGSDQKNLTNTAAGVQDDFPDYSPDGKKIAYDSDGDQPSNREGNDEVYLMNADGSRQQNRTGTGSNVNDVTPDLGSAEKN